MKTTVVLSSYNGEKYIREQLESILRQTRLPDEVLIADDGSSDSTVEICRTFIRDHGLENWSVQVNAVNKGWADNFSDAFLKAFSSLDRLDLGMTAPAHGLELTEVRYAPEAFTAPETIRWHADQ